MSNQIHGVGIVTRTRSNVHCLQTNVSQTDRKEFLLLRALIEAEIVSEPKPGFSLMKYCCLQHYGSKILPITDSATVC